MRPVVTPAEMAEADRRAIAAGTPEAVLVERAGAAVARHAARMLGGTYGRRVVVVCGKGNNGADGLVAARRLAARGVGVDELPLADGVDRVGPAACAPTVRPRDRRDVRHRLSRRARRRRGARRGGACYGERLRRSRSTSRRASTARPARCAARPCGPHETVCFAALKPGLLFEPGRVPRRARRVADIGIESGATRLHVLDVADLCLPGARVGRAQVVVGRCSWSAARRHDRRAADGEPGRGPLRRGNGRVRAARQPTRRRARRAARSSTRALPADGDGDLDADAAASVREGHRALPRRRDRAGARSRRRARRPRCAEIVAECPAPIVVDADALNALAVDLASAPATRSAAGSAARDPHAARGRVRAARRATRSATTASPRPATSRRAPDAIVLLKGPGTVIAAPDGNAVVNRTDSPALATAGTGDVLTGIIAGLLANGAAPFAAAATGAYVHGRAATTAGTGDDLVATDLIGALHPTLEALRSGRDVGDDGSQARTGPSGPRSTSTRCAPTCGAFARRGRARDRVRGRQGRRLRPRRGRGRARRDRRGRRRASRSRSSKKACSCATPASTRRSSCSRSRCPRRPNGDRVPADPGRVHDRRDRRAGEGGGRAPAPREPLPVHLKVDTGMHRVGCDPERARRPRGPRRRTAELRLAGVCTHFAVADEPADERTYTDRQRVALRDACSPTSADAASRPGTVHACNTAGALTAPAARYDMVRDRHRRVRRRARARARPAGSSSRPSMSVKARVSHVQQLAGRRARLVRAALRDPERRRASRDRADRLRRRRAARAVAPRRRGAHPRAAPPDRGHGHDGPADGRRGRRAGRGRRRGRADRTAGRRGDHGRGVGRDAWTRSATRSCAASGRGCRGGPGEPAQARRHRGGRGRRGVAGAVLRRANGSRRDACGARPTATRGARSTRRTYVDQLARHPRPRHDLRRRARRTPTIRRSCLSHGVTLSMRTWFHQLEDLPKRWASARSRSTTAATGGRCSARRVTRSTTWPTT